MRYQILGLALNLSFLSFLSNISLAQSDLMDKYMLDIQNTEELTIRDLVHKYHPNSLKDSTIERTFSDFYEGLRTEVRIQEIKVKPVISSRDLPDILVELDIPDDENKSVFLVFDDKRYLFPVLIEDDKIVSTIIISKGKRKYFLII